MNSVDFEKLWTRQRAEISAKECSNISTKHLYVYMITVKTHKNGVYITHVQLKQYMDY